MWTKHNSFITDLNSIINLLPNVCYMHHRHENVPGNMAATEQRVTAQPSRKENKIKCVCKCYIGVMYGKLCMRHKLSVAMRKCIDKRC